MNTQIIRDVFDEELAMLLPDSVDSIWSTVIAKWTTQQQQQAKRQIVRRGLVVTICILIAAFLVSPQLRVAAMSAFSQWIGIASQPGQPVIYTPSPPFTVWQPDRINDLELVQVAYNPNKLITSPNQVEIQVSGNPTLQDVNITDKVGILFTAIDENWDSDQAAILQIYRAVDGDEIWLYERATLPGEQILAGEEIAVNDHSALLDVSGQNLILTWLANDTKIVVHGTVARRELIFQFANSLIITSTPTTQEVADVSDTGAEIASVVEVKQDDPGPNATIWSDEPMLTDVLGQQYYGRLVVEVWSQGSTLFYSSDEDGNPPSADFFDRAIGNLQDYSEEMIITNTPWTDEPVLGEVPNQNYLGRVVVEVWDEHISIAITGTEPIPVLAQRGLVKIEQIYGGLGRNPP